MIRSTFAGFTTAYSGLVASQKGLDVTGQNITNVNTEGYTRQRLDLYSRSSSSIAKYSSGNRSNVGYGVGISGISQARNTFLDNRFRSEMSKMGETSTKLDALGDLELTFNKFTDVLNDQFQDFRSTLQSLSKNVDSSEFDAMARSSAETLVRYFSQYAEQISTVGKDQIEDLKGTTIPDINGILGNIANLNRSIKSCQLAGQPALELLDQRNLLLDELSQYVPIDVVYSSEMTPSGKSVENLEIRMPVPVTPDTLEGYITLLDHTDTVEFSYKEGADGKAKILIDDLLGASDRDITDLITSGMLKGTLDVINKEGELDSSDVRGVGYYSQAFDALVSKFAEEMNKLNRVVNPASVQYISNPKYDPDDPAAEPEFINNPIYDANAAAWIERPLFATKDGSATFTAANISVSQGWLNNQYGITISKQDLPSDATGANDNVLKMIELFSSQLEFTSSNGTVIGNGTFQGFFSQIGNTLDMDIKALGKLVDNYDTVMTDIYDQRESLSAVNLDEEAINILRYEKSYEAAARLMTALDEFLDTIINRMGIVGR